MNKWTIGLAAAGLVSLSPALLAQTAARRARDSVVTDFVVNDHHQWLRGHVGSVEPRHWHREHRALRL